MIHRVRSKKPLFNLPRATVLAAATFAFLPSFSAKAVDVLKQNNNFALNLPDSWVGTSLPSPADIAVWDGTVVGSNASALGGSLSLAGIRIANPGGTVTVADTAGATLALGASGIDMSSATQNLTINANVLADAPQAWSLAAGRALNLWTVNTGRGLSGIGEISISGPGAGSATVVMLPGSNGSLGFNDANSNSGFFGNWNIGPGVTVQNIRNGRTAWGAGSIHLNGGTIAQVQGNWTWTNDVVLGTGTNSTIANSSTGSNRFLKLQGTISGDGNLNFADTTGAMGNATLGFIVTGANLMSGTVTIPGGRFVRVGGIPAENVSTNAGTGGTLGTAAVVNNGTLTLSHSDAWTFSNNVSGSGALVIGNTGITGTATQVVTVSGTNTYTGVTTVNNGRLNLTGSLTSAVSVGAAGAISGGGSTTGSATFAGGAQILVEGGVTLTGLVSSGVTFSGPTKASFLTAPIPTATYDILTYGTGGITNAANLAVNAHGTLADTGTKLTFSAAGAQTRTWNAVSDTWQEGGNTPWLEGDHFFYNGDSVTFGEPALASTVTLVGQLAPGSVTVGNTSQPYTLSGAGSIAGSTGLSKSGAGALTISSNTHSFTGNVAINGGTVNTGTGQGNGTTGFLGAVTGSRVIAIQGSGTVVNFNANNQFGGTGKSAATIPTVVIDGATLNSTRFNILGNIFLNSGATLTQSATDTGAYEGYEFIGGTVSVGGSGVSTISSGNGRANHLAGGRLTTFDVGNATGDTAADLVISAVLRNGSGDYAGAGSLTKTGNGTLELAATNTYTGSTTVNGGTLLVTGSISGSATTVNASGVLSGGGTGFPGTVGAVLVNEGGVLAPGSGIGTLNLSALDLAAHSVFRLEIETAAAANDIAAVAGPLTLAASGDVVLSISDLAPAAITSGVFPFITYTTWNGGLFQVAGSIIDDYDAVLNPTSTSFTVAGNTFQIDYNAGGNSVALVTVPEPNAVISLFGGLAVLLGFGRSGRRRG